MKQEERWAQEYLEHRGFKDVVFEPDGNVPPDFLVNGNIAIEVRRLNQHHEAESGEPEGLEQLAAPLDKRLKALLETLGPPENDVSWYVSYTFKRPQLTKKWQAVVLEKLRPFQSGAVDAGDRVVRIDRNFRLSLKRASEPGRLAFFMGGHIDSNAGGWVVPELKANLTRCIREKTLKIEAYPPGSANSYRSRYPEWWLIFVDFINGGTQEPVRVKHNWDKVLVMHPSNYAGAYEIKSSG
jgi:hypothetical protein